MVRRRKKKNETKDRKLKYTNFQQQNVKKRKNRKKTEEKNIKTDEKNIKALQNKRKKEKDERQESSMTVKRKGKT